MRGESASSRLVSSRLVPPSGPVDAAGMLVGEAPGETEHHQRRPFCGKAGQVLNTYLKAAGLPRPDLRVTNLHPYWPGPGNPEPTKEQIKKHEHLLVDEIRRVKPRVIGAVGRVAAQWFLGPDIDIETAHGQPFFSDKAPGTTVVVITHPAAGFYNPALAAYSQEDILRFAHYLQEPAKPKKVPKIKVKLVRQLPPEIRRAAVDTEGLEDRPWGLSYSFDGVTTYVYIWDGKPIQTVFDEITFQNALHDLVVLRAMGVDTDQIRRYDDTMVKLYNLQLEPQGLKAAAFRHLGLKMQSFDDVVRPHFDPVALDYLELASRHKYPKPKPQPVEDYTKRKWRLYKPWDAGRRIKSILSGVIKQRQQKTGEPIKLEKKWRDLGEDYCLQIETKMKESFPDFSISVVPEKQAVQYSGIDAAATKLLDHAIDPLIEQKRLRDVYEMDRRYLPFVDKMQQTGIRCDVEKLKELEAHLETIRDEARQKVQRIVGDRWFNPGSDDQVGRWLYKSRGVPILKWTNGGEGSTSIVTLKMIQGYYGKDMPDVADFTKLVREYRESDMYLGTFVLPIFEYMRQDENGDWRIHPNYRVTRVVSGRNSSHAPNVMAFPTRTELGKMIRKCFTARDGYKILSVDASQIELRMMAHLCRDPQMRDAFEKGIDLHSLTASIIFKISIEKFKKPMAAAQEIQRYIAKTINFAVMYGISARALLEQMYKADIFDFDLKQCQEFIDEWFRIYGSVRRFLERIWAQAERDGFVRDMWGRMCYVPNLRVGDDRMRESAQRLAGNMPVQGGARGLVKRAQIRVHEYAMEHGLYEERIFAPWLDMHDELTGEVRQDEAETLGKTIQGFFCADQAMIRVPIKAEYGIGESWAAAK